MIALMLALAASASPESEALADLHATLELAEHALASGDEALGEELARAAARGCGAARFAPDAPGLGCHDDSRVLCTAPGSWGGSSTVEVGVILTSIQGPYDLWMPTSIQGPYDMLALPPDAPGSIASSAFPDRVERVAHAAACAGMPELSARVLRAAGLPAEVPRCSRPPAPPIPEITIESGGTPWSLTGLDWGLG